MQERVFDIIFKEDEISWQSMIYELVRTEQMDPWDIDIGMLSQRFLDKLKKLKEMDFRISGKVVLAAAILLRLKSHKLVKEDLTELDRIIAMSEQTQEEFYEELEQGTYDETGTSSMHGKGTPYRLVPHTPQPRKRKVSVYDLVDALQKALEVKRRRSFNLHDIEIKIPEHTVDITEIIEKIHAEIKAYFFEKKESKLPFSLLVKSDKREEKIYTFIPLLHLSNQGRINLEQEKHLAEIYVMLNNTTTALPSPTE